MRSRAADKRPGSATTPPLYSPTRTEPYPTTQACALSVISATRPDKPLTFVQFITVRDIQFQTLHLTFSPMDEERGEKRGYGEGTCPKGFCRGR